MPLDIEIQLLLNNLIKKHYDFFKVLDNSFSRYIVDQHRHYSEYPDEPPFYLISSIYELDRMILDYCVFGAMRITNPHDACSKIIKYKFWLYYNMQYSAFVNDLVIARFNKVVDKCITILKLNDEIMNPLCNMCFYSSKN